MKVVDNSLKHSLLAQRRTRILIIQTWNTLPIPCLFISYLYDKYNLVHLITSAVMLPVLRVKGYDTKKHPTQSQ
jgi:hypothetical protein